MYFGIARGRCGSPKSLFSPTPAPRPVLALGLEAENCDPPVCEVSPSDISTAGLQPQHRQAPEHAPRLVNQSLHLPPTPPSLIWAIAPSPCPAAPPFVGVRPPVTPPVPPAAPHRGALQLCCYPVQGPALGITDGAETPQNVVRVCVGKT